MKRLLTYRASELPANPPIWQLGALWVLFLLILACAPGPEGSTPSGADSHWRYVDGPHGEHCLFWSEGSAQTSVLAMDCDTVKP